MSQKIHVIGIGSDGLVGLTTAEREILAHCELLFGPENLLRLVDTLSADKKKRSDPIFWNWWNF